jgi:hypothetical protein
MFAGDIPRQLVLPARITAGTSEGEPPSDSDRFPPTCRRAGVSARQKRTDRYRPNNGHAGLGGIRGKRDFRMHTAILEV